MPETYKIGEAASLLRLKTYVLRFWESEFPDIVPLRTGKGQRLYTAENLALIQRIQYLLHEQGLTIGGARKALAEEKARGEVYTFMPPDSDASAFSGHAPDGDVGSPMERAAQALADAENADHAAIPGFSSPDDVRAPQSPPQGPTDYGQAPSIAPEAENPLDAYGLSQYTLPGVNRLWIDRGDRARLPDEDAPGNAPGASSPTFDPRMVPLFNVGRAVREIERATGKTFAVEGETGGDNFIPAGFSSAQASGQANEFAPLIAERDKALDELREIRESSAHVMRAVLSELEAVAALLRNP
jgi:DNA-binding transcriptional MerR regulator